MTCMSGSLGPSVVAKGARLLIFCRAVDVDPHHVQVAVPAEAHCYKVIGVNLVHLRVEAFKHQVLRPVCVLRGLKSLEIEHVARRDGFANIFTAEDSYNVVINKRYSRVYSLCLNAGGQYGHRPCQVFVDVERLDYMRSDHATEDVKFLPDEARSMVLCRHVE